MAMIDPVDTYMKYVMGKVALLNPLRQFGPILQAQDWPQPEVAENTFYLLVVNIVPVPNKGTRANELFAYQLQWNWLNVGDNLAANQVGANRGDRYRSNLAMVEELRQANFPGFCPKQFIASDGAGNISFQAYDPVETVTWSALRFPFRSEKDSSLLYGVATLELMSYSDVNPLMNG